MALEVCRRDDSTSRLSVGFLASLDCDFAFPLPMGLVGLTLEDRSLGGFDLSGASLV